MLHNSDRARRYRAYVSILGTTKIHLRNPWIIAWWSAAFPGFGHLLLSKYIRGYLLVLWEFIINLNTNLNEAIILSFNGQFELAKTALEPRWMLLYIPIYIYAIWDSYRTSVDLNKLSILAERENARIINFQMTGLGINYLDKRKPWLSLLWSFFMPGAGQLYIDRIATAFFIIIWLVVVIYFSHFLEGIHLLILGDFSRATAILNGEWLLFLPSLYFFAMYDAYANTVENNKLFETEQRNFFKKRYQNPDFVLPLNLTKRDE